MKLVKLTPHIYYSEPERETDRPVLGYIAGNKRAVMVDAGNSRAHYEAYRELLRAHRLRMPEERIVFIRDIYGDDWYQGRKRDRIKQGRFIRRLTRLISDSRFPDTVSTSPRNG